VPNPSSIPIRFYLEFWSRDFPSFPLVVQDQLGKFLEELQENPTGSRVLAKCTKESADKDRYACLFYPGYVVYWRLIREKRSYLTTLKSEKVLRIDVLLAGPRDKQELVPSH